MKNVIARFVKDESGATAIEYGLIAALIAVAAAGTMGTVGSSLDSLFEAIDGDLAVSSS